MAGSLRRWWRRAQFRPGLLGFLGNPYYLIRRHLWQAIRAEAPRLTGRVLDVGCGSKPYRDLFATAEYVGMDVRISGHDHEGEDIDVFYDGVSFPFHAAGFDVVFMSEVLEHVPDASATLAECRRVLRPGGHLLLTMPFLWGEHEMPFDHRRFTSVGLDAMLRQAGFLPIRAVRIGAVLETVVQLWADALTRWLPFRLRWLRGIRNILIAPGINIAGTIARWMGPSDRGLFLGHVIIASTAMTSAPSPDPERERREP